MPETLSEEKKYKVFFVDDEQAFLDIYKAKFELAGFLVGVCNNALKAFEQINTFEPDIIFLDLVMPGLDGWNLLKKIRTEPKNKWIPIIMLSNIDNNNDKQRCSLEGACDYLIKSSFTPGDLLNYTEGVLKMINTKTGA